MPDAVLWFGRALALVGGWFIVYGAALLTESEEGRLENRLQLVWERLTAAGGQAVGRHLEVAKGVSAYVNRLMDAAYGPSLWSPRAAGTSFLLCAGASVFVFLIETFDLPTSRWMHGAGEQMGAFVAMLVVLTVAMAGLLPLLRRNWFRWSLAALLAALSVYLYVVDDDVATTGLFVVAAILDLFVVGMVRLLFRAAARASTTTGFMAPLIGSLALSYGLMKTPFFLAELRLFNYLATLAVMFTATAATAVAPLMLALISASVLLHQLVWPSILRPLYSARRHRLLFDYRVSSIAVGGYLVVWALWPDRVDPRAVVQAVLKTIGVTPI